MAPEREYLNFGGITTEEAATVLGELFTAVKHVSRKLQRYVPRIFGREGEPEHTPSRYFRFSQPRPVRPVVPSPPVWPAGPPPWRRLPWSQLEG